MFYTFFANCKTHNIDPHKWLTDILNRIPEYKGYKQDELFPENWKKQIRRGVNDRTLTY